jgi:hypothetical protein
LVRRAKFDSHSIYALAAEAQWRNIELEIVVRAEWEVRTRSFQHFLACWPQNHTATVSVVVLQSRIAA